MDGQPIAERLEGTALSIDPGAHTFTFETAGQANIEKQFVVHEGEKDRRERIVFGAPMVTAAPTPRPAPILASARARRRHRRALREGSAPSGSWRSSPRASASSRSESG